MTVHSISDLNDPRIEAYRSLKDRELARNGNRFIAEGETIVRRLLRSDFSVESVLLSDRRVDEMIEVIGRDIPVYCAPKVLMDQILGLKFHSGVIACGLRKKSPTVEEVMNKTGKRSTLVICPEISNVENLGTMVRVCSAFGVDAIVLGEHCHDAFWRQAIRVSMGTVFSIPIVRTDDLKRDLKTLRELWNVKLIASVLDENAEPLVGARRSDRMGILFGNEAQGLSAELISLCNRKVAIPMQNGTDSLNVAMSAGIFLHYFMQLARED